MGKEEEEEEGEERKKIKFRVCLLSLSAPPQIISALKTAKQRLVHSLLPFTSLLSQEPNSFIFGG